MNNHEMLKEIIDKIGYEINVCEFHDGSIVITSGHDRSADVREIIFNQKFIEKLAGYLFEKNSEDMKKRDQQINNIMKHLDNPTQYLHNLIK